MGTTKARAALRRKDVESHIARFEALLIKTETCWYLEGSSRDNGYSQMSVNGRVISGHRFAYVAYVGEIESNLEVDHLCRDRACVRPNHLELVTRAENLRRRDRYGSAMSNQPLLDRLMARRDDAGGDGCWRWVGATVRGYGVISVSRRTMYVHRVAYELLIGPLAEAMTVDHLCRTVGP